MANYASLRGPVGLVRVFFDTGGARTPAALREAWKAGRGFVSNSPLLGLEIGGERPGGTIAELPAKLPFRVAMRSPVPVDHLELVHNGRVIQSFELGGERRSFDASGELEVTEGGWMLLRAWNDGPHPQVFDLYPYATTNPVYIQSPAPPPATADAAYFLAWMNRVIEAANARGGWNDDVERTATLGYLGAARDKFRALAGNQETQ
jgi:TolB protein